MKVTAIYATSVHLVLTVSQSELGSPRRKKTGKKKYLKAMMASFIHADAAAAATYPE